MNGLYTVSCNQFGQCQLMRVNVLDAVYEHAGVWLAAAAVILVAFFFVASTVVYLRISKFEVRVSEKLEAIENCVASWVDDPDPDPGDEDDEETPTATNVVSLKRIA